MSIIATAGRFYSVKRKSPGGAKGIICRMSYCFVRGGADMTIVRAAMCALFLVCLLASCLSAGLAAPADQPADPNDKKIADYTAIIAKNPKDAVAYYFRGSAYLAKNAFALAVEDLSRAAELNPRYAAAFFNRGYAFYRLGESDKDMDLKSKDIDRALEDYGQAIRLDPAYGLVYAYRALLYLERGMNDEALADCNKALELGVRSPSTYFDKAQAQQSKGQYEEAIATLRTLISNTTDQAAITRAQSLIRALGGTL